MAGAALGLVFARWSGALIVRQLSTWEGDVSLELALDWRVLGFSVALACASAIVAGVAPAFGLRSVAAGEALKDAGRGLAGDRRFAVRGTLVVAQIAMSLMLVTAAGLFLRSFASLNQLPLGFVPEPLLIAELDLQASVAPIEQRGPRAERLRAAAAAVPGVRSASLSRVPLLTGGGWGANRVAIDDGPMPVEDLSAPSSTLRSGAAISLASSPSVRPYALACRTVRGATRSSGWLATAPIRSHATG
jgi:hypothetical protein